jgi:hypothetical protein
VLTPPPPTRSDDAPPGQRYNRHADAYQPLSDRGKRAMGFSGNRIITALFYLSPVARGGSTGFANLKFEVAPKIGKLLVFHNCYEGSCQVRTYAAAAAAARRGDATACVPVPLHLGRVSSDE